MEQLLFIGGSVSQVIKVALDFFVLKGFSI